MLVEQFVKRVSTGVLTTTSGGAASATMNKVNGVCLAVEVILGTSTSAVITLTNDQGVTFFTKTVSSTGMYNIGVTLTDGTNNTVAPIPIVGDVTAAVASGGNARTLTINLYTR